MIEAKLLSYGLGTLQSWQAFQAARKKYPGVRRFTVDHSGESVVARPIRPASRFEQEQQRLSSRLRELGGQEQQRLTGRLLEIKQNL